MVGHARHGECRVRGLVLPAVTSPQPQLHSRCSGTVNAHLPRQWREPSAAAARHLHIAVHGLVDRALGEVALAGREALVWRVISPQPAVPSQSVTLPTLRALVAQVAPLAVPLAAGVPPAFTAQPASLDARPIFDPSYRFRDAMQA